MPELLKGPTRPLPPAEERNLEKYFQGDKGPKTVLRMMLTSPFHKRLHPLVAEELAYQDIRDLLAILRTLQRDPNNPTSYAISGIPEPHYTVWSKAQNNINGALAEEIIGSHQPPGTLILHKADLDAPLKKTAFRVGKGSFAIIDPQTGTPEFYGTPSITIIKGNQITDLVDYYGGFNARKPFPYEKMAQRAESLKAVAQNPNAQQVFLNAISKELEKRGIKEKPTFAEKVKTKALLVRSSNRVTLDNLTNAYGHTQGTSYRYAHITEHLTLAKIADSFPKELEDWRRFYPESN